MALAGHLIVRLVFILFGIFVAMVAASMFLSFGLYSGILTEFFTELQWVIEGDPYMDPADSSSLVTLLVVVIGFFTSLHVISIAALPAFIAIALAEAFRWQGLTMNLVMGGAVAFATGLSVIHPAGGGLPSDGTLVVLLATGFIGGFFYWVFAGRGAGRWLDNARPARPVR